MRRCPRCGGMREPKHDGMCGDCHDAVTDRGPLLSHHIVRCPFCGSTADTVDRLEHALHDENVIDHECGECLCLFRVDVYVSWTFCSPEMLEEPSQ